MKKIGLCLIVLVLAVVLGLILPWDKLGDLRGSLLGDGEDLSSLKVYSLGGDMQIFIDGEEKGTVLETESYLEIFPISVGEHEITLRRKATSDGFYADYQRTVLFEKGFDVVISWEIGPTEESSSGWLLYAQKATNTSSEVPVQVQCKPDNCSLSIDEGESITNFNENILLSTTEQHAVKAMSDGYQDLEFLLFPEEATARQQLEGYSLFLEVNLYQIPLY